MEVTCCKKDPSEQQIMSWKEKEVWKQWQKQAKGDQVDRVPIRRMVTGNMVPAAGKANVWDGQHMTNPDISYFTGSSAIWCTMVCYKATHTFWPCKYANALDVLITTTCLDTDQEWTHGTQVDIGSILKPFAEKTRSFMQDVVCQSDMNRITES